MSGPRHDRNADSDPETGKMVHAKESSNFIDLKFIRGYVVERAFILSNQLIG
jgi:hypothetical protein